MRHRGGAKLPTRDSLMHHPAGSPWCSPVAQSGGTEVQVLTYNDNCHIVDHLKNYHRITMDGSLMSDLA